MISSGMYLMLSKHDLNSLYFFIVVITAIIKAKNVSRESAFYIVIIFFHKIGGTLVSLGL